MGWSHFHIIINHIPVIGIGFILLLLVIAAVFDRPFLKKTTLWITVAVALITGLVFWSGFQAEGIVMLLQGIPNAEYAIEHHEHSAMVSMAVFTLLGLAALAGVLRFGSSRKNRDLFPRWYMASMILIALVTAGSLQMTANLGGQIHHVQVRDDALSVFIRSFFEEGRGHGDEYTGTGTHPRGNHSHR